MDFPGKNSACIFRGPAAVAVESGLERMAFNIWKSKIQVCAQITTAVDAEKQAFGLVLETENEERYFGILLLKDSQGSVVSVFLREDHSAFQALTPELRLAFTQLYTDCEAASACLSEDDKKIVEEALK